MEFILIVIFIGWLYTLMDNSSTKRRNKDEFNDWLNESFENDDKSFSDEDPILNLKRELYTKSKYIKHTKYAKEKRKEYNKNKPPKTYAKPYKQKITLEPALSEDPHPVQDTHIEYDLYTGSNEWYADKRKYLQSQAWYTLKHQRQDLDDHRCLLCHSPDNLNCHHITYKNIFNEPLDDLRTLCNSCHHDLHTRLGMSHDGYFPIKDT